MTATIIFDQIGLPAGVPGEARSDGLSNGATVTVTNGSGQPCRCEFWWKPPDDTVAVLAQLSDVQWEFDPQPSRYGEYVVRMIEAEGTAQETEDIKAFGIRYSVSGLLLPALNSRGDPNVNLSSTTAEKVAAAVASFQNESLPDAPTINYANWWQSMRELYEQVEALSALPTGIVQSVVWDPDIVTDTAFRKRLFESCVLALQDGYGIIYLAHDAINPFNYLDNPVDLGGRIAVVATTDDQEVNFGSQAQWIDPWFIDCRGGSGVRPLQLIRTDNDNSIGVVGLTGKFFWMRSVRLTTTTGTPGGSATLEYIGTDEGTLRVVLVDCTFEESACIKGNANLYLHLYVVGNRTTFNASDVASGFRSGTHLFVPDGEFEWDEDSVGPSLNGTTTILKNAPRYPHDSVMLQALANDGTTVLTAVEHDVGTNALLFNGVPLTTGGAGNLFLADDGVYKSIPSLPALDYIAFGAAPATVGQVRFTYGNDVYMRNEADTANRTLIQCDEGTGNLKIGVDSSLNALPDTETYWAANYRHSWTIGASLIALMTTTEFRPALAYAGALDIGSPSYPWGDGYLSGLSTSDGPITDVSYLSFGTVPASQGVVRFDGEVTWYTRTTGGTNQTMFSYYPDGSGTMAVGPALDDPSAGSLYLRTYNGNIYFQTLGTVRWNIANANGNLYPSGTVDFGTSVSRISTGYFDRTDLNTIRINESGAIPSAPASGVVLYATDEGLFVIDSNGTVEQLYAVEVTV